MPGSNMIANSFGISESCVASQNTAHSLFTGLDKSFAAGNARDIFAFSLEFVACGVFAIVHSSLVIDIGKGRQQVPIGSSVAAEHVERSL